MRRACVSLALNHRNWSHLGLKGFCMFYVKQFAHLQRWAHIFRLKNVCMVLFPMNMSYENSWSLLPGFRQLTTSRIQGLMKGISAHQPVTFKTPPGLTKPIFWPFVRNMGNKAYLISLHILCYCENLKQESSTWHWTKWFSLEALKAWNAKCSHRGRLPRALETWSHNNRASAESLDLCSFQRQWMDVEKRQKAKVAELKICMSFYDALSNCKYQQWGKKRKNYCCFCLDSLFFPSDMKHLFE